MLCLNVWIFDQQVWRAVSLNALEQITWLWRHKRKERYCACLDSDIHCENRKAIIVYVLLDIIHNFK